MTSTKPSVKPGYLKPFLPFAEMPPEYVIIAANFAAMREVERDELILEENSEDVNDYFLVDGEVQLTDVYGTKSILASNTRESSRSLPQTRPSVYQVIAASKALLISLPQEVIRRVRAEAPEKDLTAEDTASLDITQTREFFNDFKEELHMNRVRLPSLKSSASRVHRLLRGKNRGKSDLVSAVSMDPAITAKLMKMANSPLFNLEKKVSDFPSIVERLGVYSTREIAACFAFRDVFKNPSSELVERLRKAVYASRQVSVMATAIAEVTSKVDPQVAVLAGLLHNVGVLPIFSYSMHSVAYSANPALVDRAIKKMGRETGVLLAKKWRYSEEVIRSIEQSRNWSYPAGDVPDLTNVVLAAKYHYIISHGGVRFVPKPHEVPSIAAVSAGNFDAKFSLRIIERAKTLVAEQRSVLLGT